MPPARRRRGRRAAPARRRPARRTSTRVAWRAWRRALVIASWAIRKTVAATAGATAATSPSTRTSTTRSPFGCASRRSSSIPGVGIRSTTASAPSSCRRTRTIARISSSVRDASPSMTRSTAAAAAGSSGATAVPACAWIAIAETWWATVSCRSRASCSRSSRRMRSSSRARALARQRNVRPRVLVATSTARPPMTSPAVGFVVTKVRAVPASRIAPPITIARPCPSASGRRSGSGSTRS